MKAFKLTNRHLILVSSDFWPWLVYTLLFACLVGLGVVGFQFLKNGRSHLDCHRIEPTIVNCTFTRRQPFRTEVIDLPNNSLLKARVIYMESDPRYEGLDYQIELINRSGEFIVLKTSFLAGEHPLEVVRKINNFLGNIPTKGEKTASDTLTITSLHEWGIVYFLSWASLLLIPLAGLGLLFQLIQALWLNFAIIWHLDQESASLTRMCLRMIPAWRISYPLPSIIRAQQVRKLRSPRQEDYTVILQRVNDPSLKLTGIYGTTRKTANQVAIQINDFLEITDKYLKSR